jgi:UDP-glucuronate 4-epimerase
VTGKIAEKNMLPMQPGDVAQTWADTRDLKKDFNYEPNTDIVEGVQEFVVWYKSYMTK